MKKYLKMLPVILWPYAYIIWFALMILAGNALKDVVENERIIDAAMVVMFVYWVVTFIDAIYGAVSTARNENTSLEVAKMNLIIKALHIPAYIFHFILGILGCMMSIWGIGIIMFVLLVDLITIALTGINAIGCVIKMCRQNVLSKKMAILAGVCSFIYCIDLVTAIALLVISKIHKQSL